MVALSSLSVDTERDPPPGRRYEVIFFPYLRSLLLEREVRTKQEKRKAVGTEREGQAPPLQIDKRPAFWEKILQTENPVIVTPTKGSYTLHRKRSREMRPLRGLFLV